MSAPRTFIGKGVRHGDAMEHAYECPDCEEGKLEFCVNGHSFACPCWTREVDCSECNGSGVRYDSECTCPDCVAELAAFLCTEHYGEERERCTDCLEARASEVCAATWAAFSKVEA